MAHSTRIPPSLRFPTTLTGTFFPPPSGSTKGSAIVPCCLHASLLVRFGVLPSLHHLGSPGDPRQPVKVQFRSGHVTDVSDKVAVWYASFNWRTVVLAVTIAAQEACHTTNVQGLDPPSARATTPGKWRLTLCGYIYWAIRLFTGSSIQHPASTAHPRFLPASCCPGFYGGFCEGDTPLVSRVGHLAAFVCLCLVSSSADRFSSGNSKNFCSAVSLLANANHRGIFFS
ncbi:hypothetical protein EDB83DRAFT_2653555 [Lactarius deliciosus]|nr:hypothetical protein EDB83DRAFT_2653555 [Lactarius deliciosus]